MQRSFRRNIDELAAIFSFVREYLDDPGAVYADPFVVDLVLEELFTNMVKYHPEGSDSIEIGLTHQGDRIRIELVDRNVEPYDITQVHEVDLNVPLDERQIGGLGLHFVREVSDEILYSHENGTSRTTVLMPLHDRREPGH